MPGLPEIAVIAALSVAAILVLRRIGAKLRGG